jgi:dipeptidase
VAPDEAVDVESLAALLRNGYEGTPFDVTEQPAFQLPDRKSPLARPFGDRELFDLLGIEPERCIGTEASGYVYVSQMREGLPAPIAGCMWFTLGPSYTSCLVPIYAGVTEVPPSWSDLPDFTRVDRNQVQWKFQLVEDLTCLRYQDAIADVRAVFQPAEARFRALQQEVETTARRVVERQGEEAAQRFVTDYCRACMERIDRAYDQLVDCLMFRYLYSYSEAAPPSLPRIEVPEIPVMGRGVSGLPCRDDTGDPCDGHTARNT